MEESQAGQGKLGKASGTHEKEGEEEDRATHRNASDKRNFLPISQAGQIIMR